MLPAGYHAHDEIVKIVRDCHGAMTIGRTVEDRAIDAVEFGEGESLVLVIAGLHPLEWIGVETALALLRELPRDRRTIVVPVVNVDGYARVEREGGRWYRRHNAHRVDLNRNWPTGHRAKRAHGSSPRSEPEVDAICRLVDAHVARGGRLDVAISLHSFGKKLLVPWGMQWRAPIDRRPSKLLAEIVRAGVPDYDVVQASRWAPGAFVRGCELDHFHAAYGARSLLVECSRGGITRDPRTWIRPFHWYNPRDPARVAGELSDAIVRALHCVRSP